MRVSIPVLLAVVLGLTGMAATCQAGVALEMVPDNPGPYFGGEPLTVDLWLNSNVDFDVLFKMIRFDFTQTDPDISLASVLAFDYSALPGLNFYWTYPELPVPWTVMPLDCGCPGYYLPFPSGSMLHIGSIGLELPDDPGVYRIDALNADEPDEFLGAKIFTFGWPPDYPQVTWRAFTGEITDGAYDFLVIPEPATLWLLVAGGVVVKLRRSTRGKTRGASACLVIVVLSCASTTMSQPTVIPAEKVTLSVDSGAVSATGPGTEPVIVFADLVVAEGASWVRLHFQDVQLSGSPGEGNESFLRITSQEDGAVQILDSFALSRWSNTTAYFNGPGVLVELLAYPGTGENRLAIDKVLRGNWNGGTPEGGQRSSSMDCAVDDRTLSDGRRGGWLLHSSTGW